jgi:hypothetical protein
MTSAIHSDFGGGLPLQEYTARVPPGWDPNDSKYPLHLYQERLSLWSRLTEFRPEQVGVAIVGRLKGRAYNLALSLVVTAPDGSTLVKDAALAYP